MWLLLVLSLRRSEGTIWITNPVKEFSAEKVGANQRGATFCCSTWFKTRPSHVQDKFQLACPPLTPHLAATPHSVHPVPQLFRELVYQPWKFLSSPTIQAATGVTLNNGDFWLDGQPCGRLPVGKEVIRGKDLRHLCNYKMQIWHPPTRPPGTICLPHRTQLWKLWSPPKHLSLPNSLHALEHLLLLLPLLPCSLLHYVVSC